MPTAAGDNPLRAIVMDGQRVYSEDVDALIREIVELGGREWIEETLIFEFNPADHPDVAKLEHLLTVIRNGLRAPGTGRARWRLRLSYVALAAALVLFVQGTYVMVKKSWDTAAAYSGRVIRKGTTYTFGRHASNPYVVLRYSDGTTQKLYVRPHDFYGISVGDSVVKWSGPRQHTRVVRPAGAERDAGGADE